MVTAPMAGRHQHTQSCAQFTQDDSEKDWQGCTLTLNFGEACIMPLCIVHMAQGNTCTSCSMRAHAVVDRGQHAQHVKSPCLQQGIMYTCMELGRNRLDSIDRDRFHKQFIAVGTPAKVRTACSPCAISFSNGFLSKCCSFTSGAQTRVQNRA